jgi:hypothetical protein
VLSSIPFPDLEHSLQVIDAFACEGAAFFAPHLEDLLHFLIAIACDVSAPEATRRAAIFVFPSIAVGAPEMCQSSDCFYVLVAEALLRIATEVTDDASGDTDDDANDLTPRQTALDAIGELWTVGRCGKCIDALMTLVAPIFESGCPPWQSLCAALSALRQFDRFPDLPGRDEWVGRIAEWLLRVATPEGHVRVRLSAYRLLVEYSKYGPRFTTFTAEALLPFFTAALQRESDADAQRAAYAAYGAFLSAPIIGTRKLVPAFRGYLRLTTDLLGRAPPALLHCLVCALGGCLEALAKDESLQVVALLAVLQGYYAGSAALPELRADAIWALAVAARRLRPEVLARAEPLLLEMLAAACALLPGCADEARARRCQNAITVLIQIVGARLPPDDGEAMLRAAVLQASKEPAIREMTKFDTLLGTRGMYEKIPALAPGVNHYVLKADILDISYGLRVIVAFADALRDAFLRFLDQVVEIILFWLGLPVRIKDIVQEVMSLITVILRLLRATGASADAESALYEQTIGTIAGLIGSPSIPLDLERALVRRCIHIQEAAAKCPWFDGARLLPVLLQLPARIDALLEKRDTSLQLWGARSELIEAIELEIQDWAALSEDFLKFFPAVGIPFFEQCLLEKARAYCQSEGSIYTGVTLLTAFYSMDTSSPERVFGFIEFLLGACQRFNDMYSDRAFECLGNLFEIYELPPEFAAGVIDFFAGLSELDSIDGFYDWLLAAFTKMIIKNQATIDMNEAMEIWIECLTIETEPNLVPLVVVVDFLVQQLAARNPVLFGEDAISRWLSKVLAVCSEPQIPTYLKQKIKTVVLGFDQDTLDAIREEGLDQRPEYWENFCNFLSTP